MKTSIATVSIAGTLEAKMAAAAQAGFNGIEIFENDLTQFPGTAADVKAMAAAHGLEILALQPFRDFECLPEPQRSQAFYRARKKFELMHELGTERLLICSSISPYAADYDFQKAADDLAELSELAKAEGFRIGFEALSWSPYAPDYDQVWDIIKRADHPNLGICLDTFHMFARGNTLDTLHNEITPDKINLVQVADAPKMNMEILQYSRHYRCFPGQGDLPVVEFAQVLKEKGYDDYYSHEIFNDEFRASSPVEKAMDGIRSLIWLDEQSDLALNASQQTAQSDSKPAVQPSDNIIDDIEFIEFAVAGEAGDQLVSLLNQLGFRETHQHKSKQVTLMRQGDINLVLNRAPESQAHQHFNDHGLSVCALGFATDDIRRVVQQTETYRCKGLVSTAGPGELNIPAIKGIGDSLMYFVETKPVRFFEMDFVALAEEADAAASASLGLKRIDHLGQTVSATDFLSAAFLYKTLFNFQVQPSQDLPDPQGLVSSRTTMSPNGKIAIPINHSYARYSSSARFLDKTSGSGVHQLAFECDDIFAAAERLSAGSVLPIPANYYRDLEARFELGVEKISKLQRYNILFDRNEQGEFLHLYTRTVHGLHFELVQRVGGYKNFGEANAFIRLAAQSRLDAEG